LQSFSPLRYAPGTILTALQEVAQHAEGRRIDWRAVVGKSATGITSAREYQMLWRHFAYHHDLEDSVDAGDQPLVCNPTRPSKPRFCCPFWIGLQGVKVAGIPVVLIVWILR
jgi:hypothetical protein